MTRPGERLRALAARVCGPQTMERVIDPLLADMQCEHAEAMRAGRIWRSRWIRLSGSFAFWRVACLHAAEDAVGAALEYARAEEAVVGRIVCFGVAGVVVATFLVESPMLQQHFWASADGGARLRYVMYLVPSALLIGLPAGLAFGIAAGLHRRTAKRRVRRLVLAIAAACSVLLLGTSAWILPDANQAFRELSFGAPLARGETELRLPALRSIAATQSHAGFAQQAARLTYQYHARIAIAFTPIVFSLFALSLSARGAAWHPFFVAGALLGAYLCYAVAISPRVAAADRGIPALVVAWLPNLLTAVLAAALWPRAAQRSASTY